MPRAVATSLSMPSCKILYAGDHRSIQWTKDIQDQILRAVSVDTFAEDSLRVLRAAQFAARFDFRIHAETAEALPLNRSD